MADPGTGVIDFQTPLPPAARVGFRFLRDMAI